MILVIDNYDSFTYNLVQYLGEVTDNLVPIEVARNDTISIQEIKNLSPSHLVISPGPCTPNEAGISMNIARELKGTIPILGVCLGHQAIAQAFGANIVRAQEPCHGKTTSIRHDKTGIFSKLENNFTATRYHSLVIEKETIPECFKINAWSLDDEIMAIHHRDFPSLIGLQFHPESILTTVGKQLLSAFLDL